MREERESDIGKTRAKGSPAERRRRSGGVRPQGKIGQGQSRGEGRRKSENTQQKGAGAGVEAKREEREPAENQARGEGRWKSENTQQRGGRRGTEKKTGKRAEDQRAVGKRKKFPPFLEKHLTKERKCVILLIRIIPVKENFLKK